MHHDQPLKLLPFERRHFQNYNEWFEDAIIQKWLHEIDEEWLEYVLEDDGSDEWVIMEKEEMVGVVGIVLPTDEYPYFVISNLAVRPERKRVGLGSRILEHLSSHYSHIGDLRWIAFVEMRNAVAQRFFEHNGWKCDGVNKDMLRYIKTKI